MMIVAGWVTLVIISVVALYRMTRRAAWMDPDRHD